MTTTLTPALALAYVRELSADVIAGVILDETGARLAGPEPLAEPARALLEWAASLRDEAAAGPDAGTAGRVDEAAAGPDAGTAGRDDHSATPTSPAVIEGATPAGAVFAARAASHAIVVVTGPFALPRVTRHDLRTALFAVSGETIPDAPPSAAPATLVAALIVAAGRAFSRHSAV